MIDQKSIDQKSIEQNSSQSLISTIQQLSEQLEQLSRVVQHQLVPQLGVNPMRINNEVLDQAIAFRWEHPNHHPTGYFVAVKKPHLSRFDELCNIDKQLEKVRQNTRAFVRGFYANNALLTGARGTGKSSIVKACLNEFHAEGLRVIELEKQYLNDLPTIVNEIADRAERFIIFCDDLAFEEGDTTYAGLKTVLDGSLSTTADNVLIYATSNRKHLVTEKNRDNLEFNQSENGEIRPGDSIEQKVSLADRFGLQIHFYTFSQDEYLAAVHLWLSEFGWRDDEIQAVRQLAIQYATQKGNRSGRVAMQFAKTQAGQRLLAQQ